MFRYYGYLNRFFNASCPFSLGHIVPQVLQVAILVSFLTFATDLSSSVVRNDRCSFLRGTVYTWVQAYCQAARSGTTINLIPV